MARQSEFVSHWIPRQAWAKWVPSELQDPLKWLSQAGISIVRVGIDNPKTPILRFFVDAPFDPKSLLAESASAGSLFMLSDGSGIGCKSYASVLYEPDVGIEPD